MPSAQSARVDCCMPHGLFEFSMLRRSVPTSGGNLDSAITRFRRMSTIWSTCSMSTGHSCTHAPHVTHDHTTSSSTTSGFSGIFSRSSSLDFAATIFGPSSRRWSRRFMIRSFGESGLPVFHAGQTCWHRPHSVHA